jgi:hypothetical protein
MFLEVRQPLATMVEHPEERPRPDERIRWPVVSKYPGKPDLFPTPEIDRAPDAGWYM